MMLRALHSAALLSVATAQGGGTGVGGDGGETCAYAALAGDTSTVDVSDLLGLLANFGQTCSGETCPFVARRVTVHFDGPGGPAGDTGMMDWTPEVIHTDANDPTGAGDCQLRNHWNAGEQIGGLTSYFPGTANGGCHDGAHSMLLTRSPEYWGPIAASWTAMGGNGGGQNVYLDPSDTTSGIAPGFMGFALRRVSDGSYIDTAVLQCTGGCGQVEQLSFAKQGVPGEKYTIDMIDHYAGGWGWLLANDFVIHQGFAGHVQLGSASVIGRSDSGEEEADASLPICPTNAPQTGCMGGMYLDSSDLELMHDGTEQVVGIRFPSVSLDANAAVTNAWLLFDVDEVDNAIEHQPVAIKIEGEANLATAPFTTSMYDISTRARTTASTVWGPAPTAIVHEELETDDVSDIVNEITSMPGWTSGMPMTFIFTYIRGTGGRWVEASRENNGIMTPALMWSWDTCAGNYEEPCVDDFFGLMAGAGHSCYGTIHGGGYFSDPPEVRCAETECPWMQGASHGDGQADHHCMLRSELCPVSCGVCNETPHDQEISSTIQHFLECVPMLDHEYMLNQCCTGDTCGHLINPDVHGVPTDYQTSCSVGCSQFIVPMWEQCGSTLYWDDVQHGTAPPSDPQMMQDFYMTCKPVFDANPPPVPPSGMGAGGLVPLGPITASVSGRPDGAEETVNTGAMYLDSSDYEIMHDGDEQVVGITFPSVDIEAGASIANAYILFDVDEVRPGQSDQPVTVNIYGEANVNSVAPSTTAFDLSSRTPTAAAVTWIPEASVGVHDDLVTPDITTIVNEITSMNGWTSGGPMTILFGHIAGAGARWVESARENNGIMTPALVIEQTGGAACVPTTGSASVTGRPDGAEETVNTGAMYLDSSDYEIMHDGDEQVVGITFPSVDIAPGDTLTNAYILFDIDEVRPGQSDADTTVSIYGEANVNSVAPSTTAFDLSSRTPTAANVMWTPEASVGVHDDLVTPDITPIVTEIVNMPGWAAGNPMTILFGHTAGAGARWVESARENNGIMTPALMWEAGSGGCGGCVTTASTSSISGRPDGAEETVNTGAMYLDSSDYEIMHDGDEQVVGITFPSVDIEAGTVLTDITILFDVDEVRPGQSDQPVTVTIYGEANVNSVAPSTTAFDLSSRVPTAAAVTWMPEASVGVHNDLVTPDLSPIVNEIVAMPGWAAGNPMTILFGHVAGAGARWVESARSNNNILTPALVWSSTICTGATMPVDGSASVTGRPDGAEETVNTGVMYLDSSDYEIMHDGDEQVVGITFPSVDIAPGVDVLAASVIFDVDEVRPGQSDQPVTVSIYGEANVNSVAPSTTAFDLSSRTPTAANVMWTPEASVGVHDDLVTPDIAPIVTEIVNMPGWAAGNPMTILFGHTAGAGARWVESARENNGIMTPALMFTYGTPGGMIPQAVTEMYSITGRPDGAEETVTSGLMDLTSSDYELMHQDGGVTGDEQVVGITFPGVTVPAGAYIAAASILFDVDEVRPGQSDQPVTMNIYGDLSANSAVPTTTAFDLSSRQPTAAAVTWQPATSANVHEDLATPDLSAIVAEIVGIQGWTPGNSMTILFGHVAGTGCRWVESARENNGIMTPALAVSYYGGPMLPPSTTVMYSVTGRPDGAEETVNTGAMYLDSSDYELMHDGDEQVVGITFPGITVPAGATVSAASVLFDVDEVRPGQSDQPVVVSIYGQIGPAATPSTTAFDLSTRPPTAASVIWTPPVSVNVHEDLVTPDISSIVNEIVNDASWTPGSGMCILFGHMSGAGARWVESSRTNNGILTPALSVTYN